MTGALPQPALHASKEVITVARFDVSLYAFMLLEFCQNSPIVLFD
jgi:hypothetical protein